MIRLLCSLLMATLWVSAAAAETPVVRVAALKFGTVNWELGVIKRHGLDRKHGFRLDVIDVISNNASAVSLQGGAADIIVSDWLWVAHQRKNGRYYRYYPYSTAVGELLVPPESTAAGLADLEGKRLGVAGGAEGKTWLLFRAFSRRDGGRDLASRVDPRFAAPPLLNGLAQTGQLDAVLTYWHFGAELKARGYRSLLTLASVLEQMDIGQGVPVLGWVFPDQWSREQPRLVNAFLAASYEAKRLLLGSDQEWQQVRPRMRQGKLGEALFEELKSGYRRGVPEGFSARDRDDIEKISRLMYAGTDGQDAGVAAVPADIFWLQFDPAPHLTRYDD